jgi:hypothetical protein
MRDLLFFITLFRADVTEFVAVEAAGIALREAVMPDCRVCIGAFIVSTTESPVKRETATAITMAMETPMKINGA